VSDNQEITSFDCVFSCKKLETLNVSSTNIDNIERAKELNLKELFIVDCPKLKTAQPVLQVPNLQQLKLFYGSRYSKQKLDFSQPKLKMLPMLQLNSLLGMEALQHVDELDVTDNDIIQDINSTMYLPNLRQLYAAQTAISEIHQYPNLTCLDISRCLNISNFEQVFKCSNLRILKLNGTKLSKADGIEKLTNLEVLDVSDCKDLVRFDPIF
jgi:Leucine-rich repeat (LRR) protein